MRNEMTNTQVVKPGVQIPYPLFCRHMENGETGIPKTCTRAYECWHCNFDQWLEEMEERRLLR